MRKGEDPWILAFAHQRGGFQFLGKLWIYWKMNPFDMQGKSLPVNSFLLEWIIVIIINYCDFYCNLASSGDRTVRANDQEFNKAFQYLVSIFGVFFCLLLFWLFAHCKWKLDDMKWWSPETRPRHFLGNKRSG